MQIERLSDDYRLALDYFPLDLDHLGLEGLGVYVIAPRDCRHLTTGPATDGLDQAADWRLSEHDTVKAVLKHLHRQGYTAREVLSRGYSQGDWLRAVVYLDHHLTGVELEDREAVLTEYLDTWQAWLWGDTYLLEVQRRVTYTAPGAPDLIKWLPVDDTAALITTQQLDADLVALAEREGLDLNAYREGVNV